MPNDNKVEFLSPVINWFETWHALVTTLRATSYLLKDLLNEDYNFILTSQLQSDPTEVHFSKYRQMSGRKFLFCLTLKRMGERVINLTIV